MGLLLLDIHDNVMAKQRQGRESTHINESSLIACVLVSIVMLTLHVEKSSRIKAQFRERDFSDD